MMCGAEIKTGGFSYVSYFYEAAFGSRRTFRSPDPPLELKMKEYIFTERNGIYIIDLQKTVKKIDEAYNFVRDIAMNDGTVLLSAPRSRLRRASNRKQSAAKCSMSTSVGSAVFSPTSRPSRPVLQSSTRSTKWKRTAISIFSPRRKSFSSALFVKSS